MDRPRATLSLLLASALTGGGAAASLAQDDDATRVAFFAASSQNGFNQAVWQGVADAAAELGIEAEVFDGEFNAEVQLAQVEDAVASGRFDGFCASRTVRRRLGREQPRHHEPGHSWPRWRRPGSDSRALCRARPGLLRPGRDGGDGHRRPRAPSSTKGPINLPVGLTVSIASLIFKGLVACAGGRVDVAETIRLRAGPRPPEPEPVGGSTPGPRPLVTPEL